ncbi:hypothetical protein CL615_01525 [archaeon]|nr:hypothetical protein [archaeon]
MRIKTAIRVDSLENRVSGSVQGSTEEIDDKKTLLSNLKDECQPGRRGDAKPTIYVLENESISTTLKKLLSDTGIQIKYSSNLPQDIRTKDKLLGVFYQFTGQYNNGLDILSYLGKLNKNIHSFHAIEKDYALEHDPQVISDKYNLISHQFLCSKSRSKVILDEDQEILILRELLKQAKSYNPRKAHAVAPANFYTGEEAEDQYNLIKKQSYNSKKPFALIYAKHSEDDNSKGRFYKGRTLNKFSSNFRKTDILIPGEIIDEMAVILPNTDAKRAKAAISKMDDFYKKLNVRLVAGFRSFVADYSHLWADLSKCGYISDVEDQIVDAMRNLKELSNVNAGINMLYVEPNKKISYINPKSF